MHRLFHGVGLFESLEAGTMDALERRTYREAIPTIERFKHMRLPPTLSAYVSRLNRLYRAMDGSKFVPMEITPNTWIGNTPTPQEEEYARGLLTELYPLMTPREKPKTRLDYERNVRIVARLIADTSFYFPLPDPVHDNPREIADKIVKKLQTKMGKDS